MTKRVLAILLVVCAVSLATGLGVLAQQPPGGGLQVAMRNFAFGTITQIDRASSAIQVQMPFGQQTRWVIVPAEATIEKDGQIALTDLQVGDSITINGVPTGITARQIRKGEGLEGLLGGMFGGGRVPGVGPGQPPGPGAQPGGGQPPGPQLLQIRATANATGKITSTDPLTVAVTDEISVVITPTENTQLRAILSATRNDVAVGKQVIAVGQADENGNVVARRVILDAELPQLGGGRRGMGGPGGPGGPGGGGGGGGAGGAGF